MSFITVRQAIRDAIAESMAEDKRVFIMGEDVAEYQGAYKVTQGLLEEFGPERVIDTPISEYGFAGIGVGAAFAGLKPIVEFMTFNFGMQAIDHIINSAAKTLYMSGGEVQCPIVFRGPNGSAVGVGAQHSQNYAAWYAHVPGLKVVSPYCAQDAKFLLKEAIKDPNPVIFLEDETLYGENFELDPSFENLPSTQARIRRSGDDITIISFSKQVKLACTAADALQSQGLKAEVIDLRSLKPIDFSTICESVKRTNRCIIVEEGWFNCGIGATISATLMREVFDYLDSPVEVVSAKDVPLPYASNLEKLALPSLEEVIEICKRVAYL
jgi:pyruvate dehydrogenase E1 component beta subunit